MNNYSSVLAVTGSLCLTMTLLLSWCLVGVRFVGVHEEGVPKLAAAPESAYGLSAHDGLLMIFYLLFAHFRLSVSPVILVAMSVGSLLNPV